MDIPLDIENFNHNGWRAEQSVQNGLFSLRVVSDCAGRHSSEINLPQCVFRGARSIYKRKEEIKKIHRFVGVRNVKYSGNVDEGGRVCLFSFYPVGGKGERQQSRSSTARESLVWQGKNGLYWLLQKKKKKKNTRVLRDRCDTLSNELRFSFDWKIFRFFLIFSYIKNLIFQSRPSCV